MRQSNLDTCLVQDGLAPDSVMRVYDTLPRKVRTRIDNSPFKLCVLCAAGVWIRSEYNERGIAGMIDNINKMEARIRAGLGGVVDERTRSENRLTNALQVLGLMERSPSPDWIKLEADERRFDEKSPITYKCDPDPVAPLPAMRESRTFTPVWKRPKKHRN